jgi:dTDP-4-dehydrorhamnose reductase
MVLGAHGMLGRDLISSAPPALNVTDADAVGDRGRVDITDRAAVRRLLDQSGATLVVNAAGFTKVDLAESEEARARAVNGTALSVIGRECARRGVSVVHFSTDYVFSGTSSIPYREDDPVCPVNAYGRTKLLGENALMRSGARSLIIRTQWLFGVHGNSFPRTMWSRARRGLETRVVTDQTGRPTYTADLAEATWELVQRDASGIFHLANSGTASWFELASVVFDAAGASTCLTPCTSADYVTPAPRPVFSVLDTTKGERVLRRTLPNWTDSLQRFIRQLSAELPSDC